MYLSVINKCTAGCVACRRRIRSQLEWIKCAAAHLKWKKNGEPSTIHLHEAPAKEVFGLRLILRVKCEESFLVNAAQNCCCRRLIYSHSVDIWTVIGDISSFQFSSGERGQLCVNELIKFSELLFWLKIAQQIGRKIFLVGSPRSISQISLPPSPCCPVLFPPPLSTAILHRRIMNGTICGQIMLFWPRGGCGEPVNCGPTVFSAYHLGVIRICYWRRMCRLVAATAVEIDAAARWRDQTGWNSISTAHLLFA